MSTIHNLMHGREIIEAPLQPRFNDSAPFSPQDFMDRDVIKVKDLSCLGSTSSARFLSAARRTNSTAIVRLLWRPENNALFEIASLSNATPTNLAEQKSDYSICRELLLARRGLLTGEQFLALELQLRSLLSNVDIFDPTRNFVSSTSLDGLLEFLSVHQPTSHPNISLSRDGRFAASWLGGKRKKITLVFDRDAGDWVGVDLESQPISRQTGAFVVNSLHGIAKPFRNWIKA